MANDIFTGGASGSPINWSVGAWSGDNPPTASDTVEEQGAGIDNTVSTIAGLILDSGSSLTVEGGGNFTVTGAGDAAFGGAHSTLNLASGAFVTVESAVTSAEGAVNVESGANYYYEGSGSTQTVNDYGSFFLTGSHNNDTINVYGLGISGMTGSDNGGVVNLEGGLWDQAGTDNTTTINMAGGGLLDIGAAPAGLIENFGENGVIGVQDVLGGGTPGSFSVDQSNDTMTFDFTSSAGPVTYTLNFDSAANFSQAEVYSHGNFFYVSPIDSFTGASGGGSNTWSTIANWSAGVTPGTYAIAEQTGAGTVNTPAGGGTTQIGDLVLASGAVLTIPTGQTLEVSGVYAPQGFGGAGSTIDLAGALSVGGDALTAAGAVDLSGGTYTFYGLTSTQTVNMAGGGTFNVEAAFGGQITGLNTAGHVYVTESGDSPGSYTINSNDTVTLNFSGGTPYTLSFDTTQNLSVTTSGGDFVITSTTPVCFASGTRIETTRGEVAVEDLAVGDLAVTASGEGRSIVWIGHRRIDRPSREAWPVRVMAGAFGEGLPCRDLRLSLGHAVCVDVVGEVFVPVSELINDVTIVREEVAEVTYWHVELESHDVLLAEGLGCESYMDAGNRAFFGREYGRLEAVDPGRVAESLTRYARPFVDHGPIVAAIHQRLAARVEMLGGLAAAVSAAA